MELRFPRLDAVALGSRAASPADAGKAPPRLPRANGDVMPATRDPVASLPRIKGATWLAGSACLTLPLVLLHSLLPPLIRHVCLLRPACPARHAVEEGAEAPAHPGRGARGYGGGAEDGAGGRRGARGLPRVGEGGHEDLGESPLGDRGSRFVTNRCRVGGRLRSWGRRDPLPRATRSRSMCSRSCRPTCPSRSRRGTPHGLLRLRLASGHALASPRPRRR